MSGCSRSRSTATLSPWTTLKTPAGTPASASSSASRSEADGSFSEGLSTNVLPRRKGIAEHPHRDHRREVERGDPGHDAERLANLVDIDAGRDLLAEATLEQLRHATGELDVLQPARDLAQGIARDLAMLGGQQRGQVLAMGLDQVPDPEQDLGPLRERRCAPGRERRCGRGDGSIDIVDRGEVDPTDDLPGRRIEDRTRPTRCARHPARPRSSARRPRQGWRLERWSGSATWVMTRPLVAPSSPACWPGGLAWGCSASPPAMVAGRRPMATSPMIAPPAGPGRRAARGAASPSTGASRQVNATMKRTIAQAPITTRKRRPSPARNGPKRARIRTTSRTMASPIAS